MKEYEYEVNGRVQIDYLPFFTQHCDMCARRGGRERGEALPACVKHCHDRAASPMGSWADLARADGDHAAECALLASVGVG